MYVDFHSHILPCADHGSDGIKTSLIQINNAHAAGIDTIVATPHFYPGSDTVDEFLCRREKAYNELMGQDLHGIKIVRAAEVQLSADIDKVVGIEKLCIENTNYMLVEFPQEPWPFWIQEAVYRLSAMHRLHPICAHIDRYSEVGCQKIFNMNLAIQVNADAFVGKWSKRNKFKKLVACGDAHIIGSDAHGLGNADYKAYAIAMKKLGNLADEVTKNARNILSGML